MNMHRRLLQEMQMRKLAQRGLLDHLPAKPESALDPRLDATCVPYAISQVCDTPFPKVFDLCVQNGWSNGEGMTSRQGLRVISKLGYVACKIPLPGQTVRMASVLLMTRPDRNYIVSVRDHWLGIKCGKLVETDSTHTIRRVEEFWEISRAQDQIVAG